MQLDIRGAIKEITASDRHKAALISLGCNFVMVGLEFYGAWISGSQGLKAAAIHSVSDVLVSSLVLFGILFSGKRPRWLHVTDNVISLLIALFILGAGFTVLAGIRGSAPAELTQLPATLAVVWVCILIARAVAHYKIKIGQKTSCVSLEADGYHSLMDMYSSVAVLVGLLSSWVGLPLDTWAAGLVGLLIIKTGLEVAAGAIRALMTSEWFTLKTFDQLVHELRGTKPGKEAASSLGSGVVRICTPFAGIARVVPKKRRTRILLGVVAGVVVVLASGFFRLQPDESGVLVRWGKVVHTDLEPGIHYVRPFPPFRLYRVQNERVRRLEFGFRVAQTTTAGANAASEIWDSTHVAGDYRKVEEEALLLTGDKNKVDLNWVVEYRVKEGKAGDFLFRMANLEGIIRAVTESCMRQTIGTMALVDILTTRRSYIETDVQARVQPILDLYDAGVNVSALRLQGVHPPVDVVPAFRDVASAREDQKTAVNQAQAFQCETIPKMRGLAKYLVADAESYETEKAAMAEGDAAYFQMQVRVFAQAPRAVAYLLHVQTNEEVLPAQRKVLLDNAVQLDVANQPLAPLLLLGNLMREALTTTGTTLGRQYEGRAAAPGLGPEPFLDSLDLTGTRRAVEPAASPMSTPSANQYGDAGELYYYEEEEESP